MFSWLKRVLAGRTAQQAQVRALLLDQARRVRTVHQAVQVQQLAAYWLPARLRETVAKALQATLLRPPATGFRRNTASSRRMGRSTSKRRRAR